MGVVVHGEHGPGREVEDVGAERDGSPADALASERAPRAVRAEAVVVAGRALVVGDGRAAAAAPPRSRKAPGR